MPLRGNPSELNETNCIPMMLQAFHGCKSVKSLIFMPGATDELYFFHRVHVRMQNPNPSLSDAVVALTNQTPLHAIWRAPFLILHTDEDPLDPIGFVSDAPTAERIKAARLASEARFDDQDWGALQPFLAKTLGIHVEPSSNSLQSHHFFRHSFAASDLTGWELLEATSLAGKTKFRVEANRVIFEGDIRHLANPTVPADFLVSMLEPPSMKRIDSIPLEGVDGRLDYFAAAPKTGRLFVAAPENHSVEVIDLKAGRRIRQITGINEPQGLAFAPDINRLLVCSRNDGYIRSFDANSFEEGPRINLGQNADNIRLDDHTAFVGSRVESGLGLLTGIDISFFNPNKAGQQTSLLSQIQLPAHPESFQFDFIHRQVFVNVPDARQIAVIDVRSSKWRTSASWSISAAEQNFPMALDAAKSRLFVGCRKPACILAYHTGTGRLLFQSPCVGAATGLFYDDTLKRLYVIGGEGAIDIFMVPDNAVEAVLLTRIWTRPQARTGLFIPELQTLAVAVPDATNGPAQILLYKVGQ